MADSPQYTPTDQLLKAIAEMSESQQRQIRLLRGLLAFAQPMRDVELGMLAPSCPHDAYDCEICGGPVPADQMDGFAARHGAVIHVNCLSTQMESR